MCRLSILLTIENPCYLSQLQTQNRRRYVKADVRDSNEGHGPLVGIVYLSTYRHDALLRSLVPISVAARIQIRHLLDI